MRTLIPISTVLLLLLAFLPAAVHSQIVAEQELDYNDLTSSAFVVNVPQLTQTLQRKSIDKREIRFTLDHGENYPLGGLDWDVQLQLEVNAVGSGGSQVQLFQPTFYIHDNPTSTGEPEQTIAIDYTVAWSAIESFQIYVLPGNLQVNGVNNDVKQLAMDHLRLKIVAEDFIGYNTINFNNAAVKVDDDAMTVTGMGVDNLSGSRFVRARFDWDLDDPTQHFHSYDLQVLKVEPDGFSQNLPLNNWDEALNIEIDNGQKHHTMTLAEGTGYYAWRVRPVGNYYPGGRSNRKNLGEWNDMGPNMNATQINGHHYSILGPYEITEGTPNSGLVIDGSAKNTDVFFYEQFDEDVNWIFNRSLTEDNRASEAIMYANGLNEVKQTQTKIFSQNTVVGASSVHDFSGRASMQVMPAPTDKQYLAFDPNFFNNGNGEQYNAEDFDKDGKVFTPDAPSAQSAPREYYSDQNIGQLNARYVPNADTKPFSRTVYNAEGRSYVQSGVGKVMGIGEEGDDDTHNSKILYGSPAQVELDRLFGTEAPRANTVLKTVTIDPNGVVGISYTGKQGKTLATTINGEITPANLLPIDNMNAQTFTVSQTLDPGTVAPNGWTSLTTTKVVVEAPDDGDSQTIDTKPYALDYTITPMSYGNTCAEICYECDYVVEISIQSLEYPTDPSRNVLLRITMDADDLSQQSCLFVLQDRTLGDLISTYTYAVEDGQGNTNSTPQMSGIVSGTVHLQTGSYLVQKKVITNNPESGTNNTYLQNRLLELLAASWDWTGQNNCCGPVNIDISGFNCDLSTELTCGSALLMDEADRWFNEILLREQTATLGNGQLYKDQLTSLPLMGDSYSNQPDFNQLIDDLCTAGYDPVDLFSCIQVYGAMLEMNITAADQITSGNGSNGSSNPPMNFDSGFDFMAEVFGCIGYNPDPNYYDCSYFELTAEWGSTAQTNADVNGVYYICTWHDGLTGGNHPTNIGGLPDVNNGGKILYVEVLDPNGSSTNTTLAQHTLCVNSNASPSPFTVGMTQAAADAFMAERLCACLGGLNNQLSGNQQPPLLAPATPIEGCMAACDDKVTAYQLAIDNFVADWNIDNKGIYTDEVDAQTGYSIWVDPNAPGFNAATDRWHPYNDLVPTTTQDCNIDVMHAQCIADCQMPISSQVLIDMQTSGCNCANVGTGCYTAPGGNGTWDCPQEFLESTIFQQIASEEQNKFQAALTHIPEYAPVAPNQQVNPNPPFMYSDVASTEDAHRAIVEFFENSLQFNMRFRTAVNRIGQGSPQYDETFFSYSTPIPYYTQEVERINYRAGNGTIYPIDMVTNVVWRPANESVSGDDQVKEINLALYCPGAASPFLQWGYSPQVTNNCPILNATSPLALDLKSQIANFWFDDAGQFHAQLVSGTCDHDQPSSVVSLETCTLPAAAIGVFEITAGSTGEVLLPEVLGNVLGNVYLTTSPVSWNTGGTDATAADVALAINNTITQPNFTAAIDPNNLSRVIVYTAGNLGGLDPLNFSFAFGGNISTSVIQNFSRCAEPLPTLVPVSGCTQTTAENFNQECPFGFEKTSVQTALNGVGYQLNGTNDDFGNDLVRFFNEALTDIIVHRSITAAPSYPMFGFTAGQSGFEYYEHQRTFLGIGPNFYTAYVSAIGHETEIPNAGTKKQLVAIHFGLHCHNAPGSPILQYVITNGNPTPASPTYVYPALTFDPSGGGFNPLQFGGAIPELFTAITQIDHFNSLQSPTPGPTYQNGSYDHLQVELNLATIASGGWSNSVVVTGNGVRTELPLAGWTYLGTEQETFFTGGAACAPKEPCYACFRWEAPNTQPSNIPIIMPTCEDQMALMVATQTQQALETCLNFQQESLIENYRDNCLMNLTDQLELSYDLNYGYYTLYYYDRAGNLIKTVPPAGVDVLTAGQLTQVADFRSGTSSTEVFPAHTMVTDFQANSVGQPESMNTPDGQETRFWHRIDGLQVLSQDAGQQASNRWSYVKYDNLGRTIEAGEFSGFTPTYADAAQTIMTQLWQNPDFPTNIGGITYIEQVKTTYTTPDASVSYNGQTQRNLRNRVSKLERVSGSGYTTTLWYSYDPHGNPEWIIEYIPEIGYKTMRYEYDLISGNVLKTYYMEGTQEQLITASEYDEDNRLVRCLTSCDGITWDRDSEYEFYQTGGMSRKEIGEDRVQGIDYVHTIDGQLKSINQVELDPTGAKDPGLDGMWSGSFTVEESTTGADITTITVDGSTTVLNSTVTWNAEGPTATASDLVAAINAANNTTPTSFPYRATNKGGRSATVELRGPQPPSQGAINISGSMTTGDLVNIGVENAVAPDEYALELGYYFEDYERDGSFIGASVSNGQVNAHNPFNSNLGTTNQVTAEQNSLFNGNISYAMSSTRSGLTAGANPLDGIGLKVYRHDVINRLKEADFREHTSTGYKAASNREYDEAFTYDLNGNIEEVERYGFAGGGSNITTQMIDDLVYHYDGTNNQLQWISDAEGAAYGSHDLGDQPNSLSNPNYVYDAAGRLLEDKIHGLTISWNTFYNKPSRVVRRNPTTQALIHTVDFEYGPDGTRVLKQVTDASGNIVSALYYPMNGSAIYKKQYSGGQTTLTLLEQTIGMAERVGLLMRNKQLFAGSGYIPQLPSIEPEPIENTTEIPYEEENGDDGSGGSGDTEGAGDGGAGDSGDGAEGAEGGDGSEGDGAEGTTGESTEGPGKGG